MLHTQSEEDSSVGRGVGRDFFQVLLENNREWALSPGGAEGDSNIRSKAGEDSEKRKFSSTLSTQKVDSRQDVPPCFAFKERRLLPPLCSDSWGHYPSLPPR